MENYENPFGWGDQSEQWIKNEARRFEKMMGDGSFVFFDLMTLEEIYFHYMRHHKFHKALQLINFALRQHPSSDELYFKRGTIHVELGNLEEARRDLERVMSTNPYEVEYVFLKAEILSREGHYDRAIHLLKELQFRLDDPADVFFHMGTISTGAGNWEDAETYFRQALEARAEFEEVVYELAFILESQEKLEAAIELYQEYLDRHPFTAAVWYNLGILYSKIGLYEKAIDAYDFSLAIDDGFASAWYNKGNAYLEMDRYDEALKCFLEAIVHEKPDLALHYNIAECYEQLGDYRMASKYYHKCTDTSPEYADAWMGLSIPYWEGPVTVTGSHAGEGYLEMTGYE